MITQKYLKEILSYNPKTGIFIWRIKKGSRGMKGDIAGCVASHGRRIIKIDSKRYLASRLIFLYMVGRFPKKEVDHIDRIRDNDSWDNLRDVSSSINQRNRPMPINNTSGIKGVRQNQSKKSWGASVRNKKGKRIWLGSFKDKLKATQVRRKAEEQYDYIGENNVNNT